MPVTPVPPEILDETLAQPFIAPGNVQAGIPAIIDQDTKVNFTPPYTADQQMKVFNEKLILEIQTQKIAIAQLKSENSYLQSQISILQNQPSSSRDTTLEAIYLS